MIKTLTLWDKFVNSITRWQGFSLPPGELVDCYKDRTECYRVGGNPDWGTNQTMSARVDPGKVGTDGVAQGTPMQLGGAKTRTVTWGSGYGRFEQWKATIPLPLDGGRYWITGYPAEAYDKRCIIMDLSGKVHELIQFDQDAPVRAAGLPQQALNRGMWANGVLIDGVATTAADLPSHAYVWGRGSAQIPHVQAFTVQDYIGGDGTDEFEARFPDGPRCGDRYFLPEDSITFYRMVNKGGECRARAEALARHGCYLIDRGGRTSFLTQAGSWARATNIHEFTVDITDLRYGS